MENNDLINLLESLLNPATDDSQFDEFATPRARLRTASTPLRALGESGPTLDNSLNVIDAPSVSMTGLMTAVLPVGIAIVDASTGRIQRVNGMLASMLGWQMPQDQIIGRSLVDLLPTIAGVDTAATLAQVNRSGTAFSANIEDTKRRPGSTLYRRCTISPLNRLSSQSGTLLVTFLDVTEQFTLRRQNEQNSAKLAEYEHQAAVRTAVSTAIARGADLVETLTTIASRIAQQLGDCCAIFLPDETGALWPWALVHRLSQPGEQLREAFLQMPPQWGQGGLGTVLSSGAGVLRHLKSPVEAEQLLGLPAALAQSAGIRSAACAPLRDAMDPFGLLLVLTTDRAVGGSGRLLTEGDLQVLGEVADQIALVAENARQQLALTASRARLNAILELISDGVALYDTRGQLQYANEAGKRLLAPPNAGRSNGQMRDVPPMRQLMAVTGVPLSDMDLPISRALRGEPVGTERPESLIIEWEGGLRRNVLVRAVPVRDAHNAVDGVVLVLRADENETQPVYEERAAPHTRRLTDPLAIASDLGDLCARVARLQSNRQRRRIEVRLPHTPIPLPEPAAVVEDLLLALTDTAIESFPPESQLVMQLWYEPVSATPRDPSASGPTRLYPIAMVRVSCPQSAHATLKVASATLARAQHLASSVGGAAMRHDDPSMGASFIARLPIVVPLGQG